jgi:hypothetical protein
MGPQRRILSSYWVLFKQLLSRRRQQDHRGQIFRDLLVWQKAHQFVLGVYQEELGYDRIEELLQSL